MSSLDNFYKFFEDLHEKDNSVVRRVAEQLGASRSHIHRILKRQSEPGLGTAEDIARALGYTLQQAIGAEPLPPPPEPRKPTQLEIALYLFDMGGDSEVPRDRIDVIKRALEADAAQLSVMRKQLDNLFDDESINDADTSSSS